LTTNASEQCSEASGEEAGFQPDPAGEEIKPMPSAATLQGSYYLVTGIWPVLHRSSFEALSGRKQDYWLVRTVGLLAASIGLGLSSGDRRATGVSADMKATAVSAALGFGAIDLVEVARGRISPIYLLDFAAQAALLTAWLREPVR
jgi:hypothetical protein